jgi:hypothetical protein
VCRACNPEQRFEYESTNPNELSERDRSLFNVGIIWGTLHTFEQYANDLGALKAELEAKTRDNQFLEMILENFRGNTPKGWRNDSK